MKKKERIKMLEGVLAECRTFVAECALKEGSESFELRNHAPKRLLLPLIDYMLDKSQRIDMSKPDKLEKFRESLSQQREMVESEIDYDEGYNTPCI